MQGIILMLRGAVKLCGKGVVKNGKTRQGINIQCDVGAEG